MEFALAVSSGLGLKFAAQFLARGHHESGLACFNQAKRHPFVDQPEQFVIPKHLLIC